MNSQRNSSPSPSRLRLMRLEPRLLFDAALAVEVAVATDTVVEHDSSLDTTTARISETAAPAPLMETAPASEAISSDTSQSPLTDITASDDTAANTPSVTTASSEESSRPPEAVVDRVSLYTAGEMVVSTSQDSTAPAREIVFVDSTLTDADTLMFTSREGVQVVRLDASTDPWQQMTATLAGQTDISAIHILSHGAEGELILNNHAYSATELEGYTAQLQSWSDHLTQDADILLYGCNIAASADGRALVDSLAAKTGADVSASADATGSDLLGGNWSFEYSTGAIETSIALAADSGYAGLFSTVALDGKSGWTAVMYGPNKDPDGDSQAGAADTDIIGDSTHGSLYVAYDDNGTPNNTSDDFMCFRMRIDNPTSSTNFAGVAIVGIDANLDGRVDLFMSVDGRNNTQAVKLLDPGTGANISPNTTTTNPLPTGWLANNGVYPFSNTAIYNVSAVTATNDPHWGAATTGLSGATANDLTGDGDTDVFVSWKIPVADIATVLAKASPVDRSGNYGPRGSTGISGFTKDTTVQYVSFTQTQPGPINGDLNGVGSSYDKNASFASLGAFTPQMSASNPVSDGPRIIIAEPISGGYLNNAEDNSVTISGTSASLVDGTQVSLSITDGSNTLTFTNTTTISGGTWTATGLDLHSLNNGQLTITATAGSASDLANVEHDSTAPTVSINQLATAINGLPTFSGTSNLTDGSLLAVTIDPDNNNATNNSLIYQVLVSSGLWSLDTSAVSPGTGTVPTAGLTSYSKVTATATDAAGNIATATALNHPTVNSLSTNDTTPTVTGTWTNIAGDTLTVKVNAQSYTPTITGNTWSVAVTTALASGSSYEVEATVTRGGSVTDTTTGEVTITSSPVVAIGINGGDTASGTDTTPLITGTSANAGGFVIVRLDPNNDGDLSDAVTYSVSPDGSGNWSLDTGSEQPISGQKPDGGFTGVVGIRATDSTGSEVDTQVLTISTPTISISSIISTATSNSLGLVSNTSGGEAWLNMTEDDAVTISGTTTGGTVDLVITDANGHFIEVSGVAVAGGTWSASGLNLSSLDNGTLKVEAFISGTAIKATNQSVVHDKLAPRIFNTTASEIKKAAATMSGGSEIEGTSLSITVSAASPTGYTSTTSANGDWTVTPSITGNPSSTSVTVSPTTQTTDAAGNIVQSLSWTQAILANASANTISINSIASDNIISTNEISSGVTISGSTTLSGTPLITLSVTDGVTTVTPTAVNASGGVWSTVLSLSDIKLLANGPLTVSATAPDGSVTIKDIALPTLSLVSPTLSITDNTPGTASSSSTPVIFTFTFSEAVTDFDSGDITVSNGTKGTFSGSGTTYTLEVTPTSSSSGDISVSVANSIATGTTTGRGNIGSSATQPFNTTGAIVAPTVSINTDLKFRSCSNLLLLSF